MQLVNMVELIDNMLVFKLMNEGDLRRFRDRNKSYSDKVGEYLETLKEMKKDPSVKRIYNPYQEDISLQINRLISTIESGRYAESQRVAFAEDYLKSIGVRVEIDKIEDKRDKDIMVSKARYLVEGRLRDEQELLDYYVDKNIEAIKEQGIPDSLKSIFGKMKGISQGNMPGIETFTAEESEIEGYQLLEKLGLVKKIEENKYELASGLKERALDKAIDTTRAEAHLMTQRLYELCLTGNQE